MISENHFIELLKKHQKGKCTPDEILLIDEFLQNKIKIHGDAPGVSTQLIDSTLKNIQSATNAFDEAQTRKIINLHRVIKVAAMLMLVTSASLWLYTKKELLYDTVFPVKYTSVTSKSNNYVSVTLADGSEVLLNRNSKITYSNRFNNITRDIQLVGEAYFKVAKNKAKPFIVHSGNLNIKVLGTSFNVEAYPSSKSISVALITGKVWVSASMKNHLRQDTLHPDQKINYNKLTGILTKNNVLNAQNYIAWKDGKIKFSNAPLDEVMARINTTYGCNVTTQSKVLLSQHIYGEFDTNDNVIEVIKAICTLTNAKFINNGNGNIIMEPVKRSVHRVLIRPNKL